MNTQQRYKPGELVTWTTLEGQQWTTRQVSVRSQKGNRATVAFGHSAEGNPRLYDVPLSELSRQEPPVNAPPLYHSEFIRPRQPPPPPSEAYLTRQLAEHRLALQAAQETAQRQRAAVASAKELVDRARAEHAAATAALAQAAAAQRVAEHRYEAAIRKGEAPPEPLEPHDDRAAQSRLAMATAALRTFESESQEADRRLGEAQSAIQREAAEVIALRFEADVEQLRQLEELSLKFRADLVGISQWWPNGGALRLSEASASLLVTPPDYDRIRFMGSNVTPWKQLFDRLLEDPAADFGDTEEDVTEQAA